MDLAAWSSLATVLTFITAIVAGIWKHMANRRRQAAQELAARKDQASSVWAWAKILDDGYDYDADRRGKNSSGVNYSIAEVAVHVLNDSAAPVTRVGVLVDELLDGNDKPMPMAWLTAEWFSVVPKGEKAVVVKVGYDLGHGPPRAPELQLAFTDAAGRHWLRNTHPPALSETLEPATFNSFIPIQGNADAW